MHENKLIKLISAIESKLNVITNALFHLLLRGYDIMAILDELTASVAKNSDAVDSAIVLLNGLKTKLDACGTDPAKLAELSAALGAKSQALADAVVANTPAA